MPETLCVMVGFVLMAMSIPLIRRKVPRNGVYGVRFAATVVDDWVWHEANTKGGRDVRRWLRSCRLLRQRRLELGPEPTLGGRLTGRQP